MLTPRPHQHSDSYPNILPLIYNESIEFRAYQKNIADSAYNNNTLVILPTALGKTVMAILVSANAFYNHRRKIAAAKQSPSFEREYNLKYLGLIGNVFHIKDIEAAIEKKQIFGKKLS